MEKNLKITLKKLTYRFVSLLLLPLFFPQGGASQEIASFPGAEGFGAKTTGGRGGRVIYVTNLDSHGKGSLNDALGYKHENSKASEPRYILFKVSGIISAGSKWEHKTHIEHGNFTLAGHTSPGGIIVSGILTWCSQKQDCNYDNMIIRHLRSRPDDQENGLDDAIRLNGAQDVIIDHCSFARAKDEVMQIAYNRSMTVQNSLFAETLGEHSDRGGILIKYSSEENPNTKISFHHNILNRIQGRVPQIDCDDKKENTFCSGGNDIQIEISDNLIWDPNAPLRFIGTYLDGTVKDYRYLLNMENNLFHVRENYGAGMWQFYGFDNPHNEIYLMGNKMNLYPDYSDYQLQSTYNYSATHPSSTKIAGIKKVSRHNFPVITHTTTDQIQDYMLTSVGAFPRDIMDRRLMRAVSKNKIDTTHWSVAPADDALLFDWNTPPIPYLDSDNDGMSDDWELCNGLDPFKQDHTGKDLSYKYTDVKGYDNLEIFLQQLSDTLVHGSPMSKGACSTYPLEIEFTASSYTLEPRKKIRFTITGENPGNFKKVKLSLALLKAPFKFPAPKPKNVYKKNSEGEYYLDYTLPSKFKTGNYAILAHVVDKDDNHGYSIIFFNENGSHSTQHFSVLQR